MSNFQAMESLRLLDVLEESFQTLKSKSKLKHNIYSQVEFWGGLSNVVLGLLVGVSSNSFSLGEAGTTVIGFSIALITGIMSQFKIQTKSEHQKQISVLCANILTAIESRKRQINEYLRYNQQLISEGKPVSDNDTGFDIIIVKSQIAKFFETLRDLNIGGKASGGLLKIESQFKIAGSIELDRN